MYTIKLNNHLDIVEVDFDKDVSSTNEAYDCINEVGNLLEKSCGYGLLINTRKLTNIEETLDSFRVGLEIQYILHNRISIAAILKKEKMQSYIPNRIGGTRVLMNTFNNRDNAISWLVEH